MRHSIQILETTLTNNSRVTMDVSMHTLGRLQEEASPFGLSSAIYFPATYSFRPPNHHASLDFEPQYYQRHTLKMDPKELAIQNAIADLNSGVFRSERAAARWHGVPRSTLQGRRSGQQPHVIAHLN